MLVRRGDASRAVLLRRILALEVRLRVVLRLRLVAWVAFHACASVGDGSLAEPGRHWRWT